MTAVEPQPVARPVSRIMFLLVLRSIFLLVALVLIAIAYAGTIGWFDRVNVAAFLLAGVFFFIASFFVVEGPVRRG
jgi:hypothetical protein